MSKQEALELLLRAHYRLMDLSRFWYEKDLIDASALLCIRASDLRLELKRIAPVAQSG